MPPKLKAPSIQVFGMKPVLTALAFLALSQSESAFAEIYKCTDESGISTFTDNPRSVPGKRCVGMNLGPIMIEAPTRKSPRTSRRSGNDNATASAAPSHFPRVDSATQSKRDQTRRQILQEEMDSEQRLLSEAQRNLSQAQNNPNDSQRASHLRNEIVAHQKNIEALQKELQRVK